VTNEWPDFNDLWNYDDPAGTEARFRVLLPQADASGDASYALQLRTQIARTLGLQKQFAEAHTLLDEVDEKAQGDDLVMARSLLERGRVFNSSGQPEQAVPLFKQAYELSDRIGAGYYAADALHMLGIASPPPEQTGWNLKAIDYAQRSSQPRARYWLGPLYNNLGWTYFEQGRLQDALETFQKAQAAREGQGKPEEIRIARWCVARTLREMGQIEAALAIQRQLEAAGGEDGFIYEEIGECLYALGRSAEAKPSFRRAYELLSQIDWVAGDTQRIERLKALGAE
jgi:tetratricopeptide (TPR) repeat protein